MTAGGDEVADESLRDLVSRLADDAKAYAAAEAAVLRETAAARGRAARSGAIMVVLSIALVSAAATALVLGMLLTATVHVGPLMATVIVVGVTLLVGGLLGVIGWGKVKRAWRGEA